MSVTRMLLATAVVVGMSSALATVASSAEQPMRPGCGYVQENGKYIFLGTCPHETSEGSEEQPPVPEAPPA